MVKEKNFASFQKQKNQKLKKIIVDTRKNNQILKNQLLLNQCDNSNNNINQNEMTKLKVSMDILKKENEELKLKVEKLEKERDAETTKSLQCQSENLTNRELILELKTTKSKLTSDLEICESTDADLLISGQELKECNEELGAEMQKSLQCESEKKNCLDGTILKDRKILEHQSKNAKITSELQNEIRKNKNLQTTALTNRRSAQECQNKLNDEIEAKEKLQENFRSFRPLWSEWGACSKHCRGIKTRMDQCSLNNKETQPCNQDCSKSGKSVTSFPILILVNRILFSF